MVYISVINTHTYYKLQIMQEVVSSIIFLVLFVSFSYSGTYYPVLSFFTLRHGWSKRDSFKMRRFGGLTFVNLYEKNEKRAMKGKKVNAPPIASELSFSRRTFLYI